MLPEAEARIREVLNRHTLVVCAWLFGSTLSDRRRADSDLDIGVLTGRKPTWQEYSELQQDLVQAAGSDAVDLVMLNEANSILRFEAICGRILSCRDRDAQAAFCSLSSREYEEDMAQLERAYRARKPAEAPLGPGHRAI